MSQGYGDEFDTWSWSDPVMPDEYTDGNIFTDALDTGLGVVKQVRDSIFYWENGYYPTSQAGNQQQDILGQAPQSSEPRPATVPFYQNPLVIGGAVMLVGVLYLAKGK